MSRHLSQLVIKNASLFTIKQFDLLAYLLVKTSSQYAYCEFVCYSLECSLQSLKMIVHHLSKKIDIKVVNDFVLLDVQSLKDFIVNTVYNQEINTEYLPINNTRQSHDVLCSFNDYLISAFHGFQYDLCEMNGQGLKKLLYTLLRELLIEDEYEDFVRCLRSNTDLYIVCKDIDKEKTKTLLDGFKKALLFENEDCEFHQLAKNHLIHVKGYDLDSKCYDSIEDFKKNEFYIDHRDISIIFDKAGLIDEYFIEFKSMHEFFDCSPFKLISKVLETYTIDACNSFYTQPFKDLHENLTHEYRNLLQVIEDLLNKDEKITLNKILSYQWIYTDKIMFKGVVFNIGAFSHFHELMFTDYLTNKGLI